MLVLVEGPLGVERVKQKDPVVFLVSMFLLGESPLACTALPTARLSSGNHANFAGAFYL